ncbi:hypothetical protein [Myceligenerans crystallogenes]|uniref:Uncharacterized protein n=1 Tax=Myceligenerans crystallogenes TaxID=316335 RepID=A0ABN2N189_9MICO
MKYVELRSEDGGIMFDARRYLEALPSFEKLLPGGARRFATDPDHYDFYNTRCVKDLALERQLFDVDSEKFSLEFAPNVHKHDEGLTVTYVDIRSIEFRMEPAAESVPWRFNVLLDEILPEGGGIRHEFELGGGTLVIEAADLEARWRVV